jgi:hypothetical protein
MNAVVFHLGDKVQEIATGRCGKIDESRNNQELWRVFFSDGGTPPLAYFKREALRLVQCPHTEPEPGFAPERGIMG